MLHWKHIKGFYKNPETNTNPLLYTFIEFQEIENSGDGGENLLPKIITREENSELIGKTNPTYYKDFGHIVTNKCDTTIYSQFTFAHDAKFNDGKSLYFGNKSYIKNIYETSRNKLTIFSDAVDIISNYIGIGFSGGRCTFDYDPGSSIAFEVKGVSLFDKDVSFGADITVDHACNAEYFNATSDIRAKEKIEPISQSMLDVVNKIQLYTFNYKDNPTERAIGLIAQEVQDVNLDGFELVANKNASGKEKDFMAIKESKLVYILLGAVKELSAEVARLKEKLGE